MRVFGQEMTAMQYLREMGYSLLGGIAVLGLYLVIGMWFVILDLPIPPQWFQTAMQLIAVLIGYVVGDAAHDYEHPRRTNEQETTGRDTWRSTGA